MADAQSDESRTLAALGQTPPVVRVDHRIISDMAALDDIVAPNQRLIESLYEELTLESFPQRNHNWAETEVSLNRLRDMMLLRIPLWNVICEIGPSEVTGRAVR